MSLSSDANPRAPSPSPSSLSSVNSLPDSASSDDDDIVSSSSSALQHESDAEREWKESLQQLELLLTMVVVPYAGKYFGRKCAYWGEPPALFFFIFFSSYLGSGWGFGSLPNDGV